MASQFYLALKAVTTVSLLTKLSESAIKRITDTLVEQGIGTILGMLAPNTSKIFNATFYYDLQMTSGLVDLMGSGVKVTAYRYANYEGKLFIGGNEFSSGGNSTDHGGWWSSSKPYGLDLPVDDI